MRVVRDHQSYRKGQILKMSWGLAVKAALQGWAMPDKAYRTTEQEREMENRTAR
jgi:hypothetical protein